MFQTVNILSQYRLLQTYEYNLQNSEILGTLLQLLVLIQVQSK